MPKVRPLYATILYLERIANAFTESVIPAFMGITLLFISLKLFTSFRVTPLLNRVFEVRINGLFLPTIHRLT